MHKLLAFLVLFLSTGSYAKPKTVLRWPIQHHEINVSFDVEEHTVNGTASLTLHRKGVKEAGFLINKDFSVARATLGGLPVKLIKRKLDNPQQISGKYGIFGEWDASDAQLWMVEMSKKDRKKAFKAKPLILKVFFSGSLYVPPSKMQFSREKITFEVKGTIGKEGIYLSPAAYWYPTLPDVLSTYNLKARLPQGWNCVTNGEPVSVSEVDDCVEVVYESKFVTDGIVLSAGSYIVENEKHNEIEITTYFFPAEKKLAEGYREACKRYLSMYSDMIAPYPFTKFALVDNFLPSGYGMPGWALIGSEVLSNPKIRFKEVSLGHEIVHNWMGNSLYVDYREGNWCEGLTVYLADYKYQEDIDTLKAKQYRMDQLRDFEAYVTPENDYPVSEFKSRSLSADRAIGYGKVMMIFHMLRKMLDHIDEKVFFQVLSETYNEYQWQPVGWSVWRKEFERRMGQKMNWFFDQWLMLKGAPEISIDNIRIEENHGRWDAKFEVVTKTVDDLRLTYTLPIKMMSENGWTKMEININKPRQGVVLSSFSRIQTIQLDPDFDLFRKVYAGETPLTLAKFFGDPKGILVIPSKGKNASKFRSAAKGLKSDGQTIVTDSELTPEMEKQSLWLFGTPEDNLAWSRFSPDPTRLGFTPFKAPRWREEKPIPAGLIFRQEKFQSGKFSATIIDVHPGNSEKTIVHTLVLPGVDPVEAARKLPHYGKYSYLLFDGATNQKKGVWVVSGVSPVAWRNKEIK